MEEKGCVNWCVFDDEGHVSDPKITEQFRSLAREVTRAARRFKAQALATPAARAGRGADAAHR